MNDRPYRPAPDVSEDDAALARLAAEGQHRILEAGAREADARQESGEGKRERNVRIALGAYHGTPVRKASYALMGVGALVIVAVGIESPAFGSTGAVVSFLVGMLAATGGFLIRVLSAPIATRAELAAERAWTKSLPFAMDGYFEMLAAEPTLECELVLELEWTPGHVPTPETVQGLLGTWDTGARVQPLEEALCIRSSTFECGRLHNANNWYGSDALRPTRHLVDKVHGLVTTILQPLHRSHAIARVSLRRDATSALTRE